MYNNSISRQDFLKSHFLTIKVIDLEKSLLHHNKFVFEIVTDRSTELCRKNYSQLKRFTSELASKQGMQEFLIQHHLRSSQQKKQLECLFKKLNNGYLMVKEGLSENYSEKRLLIRNYLYNLFYNCLENPLSEDEEAPSLPKSEPQLTQITQQRNIYTGSFHQEAKEEKQKIEETKKQEEGKVSKLSKLKNLYRSKVWKEEERKQLLMRGIDRVWLREGGEWVPKQLALEQNTLILWDATLKTVLFLKKYDIIIAQQHYRRILISHPLLKVPMELRLRSSEETHLDEDDLEDYVRLLTLLKETTMGLEGYNDEVVNFITIRISNKKNKFSQDSEKRPAKELMLKVIQDGETILVGMPIDSTLNLLLPITNHYSKLDCEVAEAKEGGIISTFGGYNIKFTLPIQNIYDQLFNEKPKRKTHEMRYFILGSKLCNYSLKIDYIERGSKWTYCSMLPNDRFQGEKPSTQFSREEFRIQKNRFKRILFYLEGVLHELSSIRNMEYPFQSYLFYLFFVLLILFFNLEYILHYTLFLIAALLIYHHPNFPNYIRELKIMLGLESWAANMEQRLKVRGWGKPKVHFRKQTERRRFLEQFKFTRKRQGSIVQKYQRLHLWLLRGQLVLTELVTFTEKVKNLFLWYHHRKTKELLLLILTVLAVLLFVPVRLILLGGLWKMFRKGLTHKLRIQETNKVIMIEILQNLVEQFGILEAKGWLLEPSKPFDKKSSDYQALQKKVKEWLSVQLQVDIDPEVFSESRCMNDLIAMLADCRKRFVIPESVCRKYKFNLEWSQSKSGLRKILLLIYGFIMSTPSDRNILGIAYEEPGKEVESDSEDLEET